MFIQHKKIGLSHWSALLICFMLMAVMFSSQAQIPKQAQDTTNKAQNQHPWPKDSLNRNTPRGTVNGFIKAVANEDYLVAAQYLKATPELNVTSDSLAHALRQLLDQDGQFLPYSLISENPGGAKGDDLAKNLDRVGTATVDGKAFDLILEKTTGDENQPIWLFSSETLKNIPLVAHNEQEVSIANNLLPNFLEKNRWGGVPVGQWMIMLVILILSYTIAWILTRGLLYIVDKLWRRVQQEPKEGILKAFAQPVRLYMTLWLFVWASQGIGVSIIVRQKFSLVTTIVGLVALLLLLWQLVDFITRFSETRMSRKGNVSGVSVVLFIRRGVKFALITLGIIIILDNFGVDVTTGLAALGIGGIALALGAQKTVENFVGSVTLIADQPIRVGDFCKVGDTVGTVEQIGMRSTRIRTLDRTIVTIPNGEFSSLKIENYAHRDRFWFHPILTLRYETTPDQIRYLIPTLRAVLLNHPQVDPTPARVRFIEMGSSSLNIEIFAYVHALNFDEFLEVKETLLLRLMDVVKESGSGFAFPSQTIYMAEDDGNSVEKTHLAEETYKSWQNNGNGKH